MRTPDLEIYAGDASQVYLRRWWVIPRNPWFNIYLHHICKSDDDRALHDHPWWNLSILLSGHYVEHTPRGSVIRMSGDFVLRRASALHRLELVADNPCWTLFITGPRIRAWGFHHDGAWVHHERFFALFGSTNFVRYPRAAEASE